MARQPSRVVMVGTSFGTKGGIASVLDGYRRAGLFERWPVDFIATHRDGNALEKLLRAVDAIVVFFAALCTYPKAVLHVHGASRASFWRKSGFMALALLARWPIVYHLHGGGFARFYEQECGRFGRAVVRFFLDRAACIVVVSERWNAWMRGVTRNPRVVTIANTVALPSLPSAARESALVAFTGRCSEEKGVYDLLQATLGLRRAIPRLRLELAGDGDLDELERSIASMGLADRVRVHGWIDRRRRDELLARAAIFVLPSHAEGLPMSLLEAMAAGCAVVASRVGGIPDVVSDGDNGLLVEPGDTEALAAAIARLAADPALAQRLGERARATIAARFTPEPALQRLGQIYSSLGVTKEPGTVPVFAPAKLRDGPR